MLGCLETEKYFSNLTMQTMYEKRVKQKLIFHNKKKIFENIIILNSTTWLSLYKLGVNNLKSSQCIFLVTKRVIYFNCKNKLGS